MQFETEREEQTYYIHSISCILSSLITESQQSSTEQLPSVFDSKTIPSISMKDYLTRLKERFKCSVSPLVLSIIYIDKYCKLKKISLTSYNIYRLYLSGLVLASKFLDDIYFNNQVYALAGGVQLLEMNIMELEMFETFEFNIMPDYNMFQEYKMLVLEYQQ